MRLATWCTPSVTDAAGRISRVPIHQARLRKTHINSSSYAALSVRPMTTKAFIGGSECSMVGWVVWGVAYPALDTAPERVAVKSALCFAIPLVCRYNAAYLTMGACGASCVGFGWPGAPVGHEQA